MAVTKNPLGPLALLEGIWEGDKGHDRAPDDDRGVETNVFRERIVFEPTGLVQNHEQNLYGLRYRTTAWRIGSQDPFHEELGYWMWDAAARQVTRCFLVPRGVSVIAGGTVDEGARTFSLQANLGSTTYGICSNPFLDKEFRTIRYQLNVEILSDQEFSYDETTLLLIKGQAEAFSHTDRNILYRV